MTDDLTEGGTIGSEGVADWKAAIPEALRDAPWIGKASSLEAAVLEMKNAAQYMGNALRIPSEDAGDDDRNAFYEKIQSRVPGLMRTPADTDLDSVKTALRALGMPENPTDYSADGIEGAPKGDDLAALKAKAHEIGMTGAQFKAWVKEQAASEQQTMERVNHERDEGLKELRNKLGFSFDAKVQSAIYAAEATGAPDYVMEMLNTGTMDAKGLEWFINMAEQLSDGTPQAQVQGKSMAETLTPMEIEARLGEVETQLFDKKTPKDRIALLTKKRMDLMAQFVASRQ